jgi:hypothetical protein
MGPSPASREASWMNTRVIRKERSAEFPPRVGSADDAQRITLNLSREISEHLHRVAVQNRVSESSVVEIALRQLFRRVPPLTLRAFLHDQGACLRRKS